MKKLFISSLFIFSLLVLVACGGDDGKKPDGDQSTPQDEASDLPEGEDAPATLSIVQGHGLRETPGAAGKWVKAINFAEELKLTGDSTKDDKEKMWLKAILKDGKTTGWIEGRFVSEKSRRGVVLVEEVEIYSMPDMTNNTNKFLKEGEMVVVKQTQGDNWTEVVAKGANYSYGLKGWVMGTSIVTTDAIDVEVSIKLAAALAEPNAEGRTKKLQAILEHPGYDKSLFYEKAEAALQEVADMPQLEENELMITADEVNLRAQPNKTSEVLAKLKKGIIAPVEEVSEEMETIGDKTDYWYKISVEGDGWVFGAFTSRAK